MRIVVKPTFGRAAALVFGLACVWLVVHVDLQVRSPKHPDPSKGMVILMSGTHGPYYVSRVELMAIHVFEISMLVAVAPIVFVSVRKALSKHKKASPGNVP